MQPTEILKEYSTIVAVIAAGISLAAFLVSWRGTRIANKAYRLSLEQAQKRDPGLLIDLLSAWLWTAYDERRYALNLTITNPTDAQNSITRAELLIHLTDEASGRLSSSTVKVPTTSTREWGVTDGLILSPSTAIDSRSAWSGWAKFSVRESIISGSQIERIELRLEDVFRNPSAIEYVNPRTIVKEDE